MPQHLFMPSTKANIIAQLRKEILAFQGFKSFADNNELNVGLDSISHAFPNSTFPLGAMHEFICSSTEDVSASVGFITGLLSSLMRNGGVAFWIAPVQSLFPPALKSFAISPDKVIFVDLQNQKDILWTIEEALKCNGLSAVVGEIPGISFTESRRFQLAVEQSKVTGFLLRHSQRSLNTTACVTRWKIEHLPSVLDDNLPGVGFPRWNVELLKVRNGKPGAWQIEWNGGRFCHIPVITSISSEEHKKAG
jgi:protein ImuA